MNKRWIITGFFMAILCTSGLTAKSVRLIKTIDLKNTSNKKTISSLLLGRSQEKAVNPGSICRIGQDRLCLTDSANGVAIIIDSQGNIIKRITHAEKRRFVSPVSACSDDAGNLYISDSARGEVIKLDVNFKFSSIFIASGQFRITGISFLKGVFYCVDTLNHRILLFDKSGDLKYSFGKRGTKKGEFNFPTHITADTDYIYITDAMNFRVQIFDLTGKFIRMFGTPGRGGGNFSKPKGIAVDKERRIYVADAMFDNVQIFNLKGEFLYYFGGPGHNDGEFWLPSGIMIDKDNTIWVADTYNSRLQVFQVREDAP